MDILGTILTADDCRDRARQFFARAVAEDDLKQREAWLLQGERWMQRWRFWTPEANRVDRDGEFYRR